MLYFLYCKENTRCVEGRIGDLYESKETVGFPAIGA